MDYDKFSLDLEQPKEQINIDPLIKRAEIFFKKNGLLLNWNEFEKLDQIQLYVLLKMQDLIGLK